MNTFKHLPIAIHIKTPLTVRGVSEFGGVLVREYEGVDVSYNEDRAIVMSCFDLHFGWYEKPTIEDAIEWLRAKELASERISVERRLRAIGREMTDRDREHIAFHADYAVRFTEWERLTADNGQVFIRGWFTEDLS